MVALKNEYLCKYLRCRKYYHKYLLEVFAMSKIIVAYRKYLCKYLRCRKYYHKYLLQIFICDVANFVAYFITNETRGS